MIKRKEIIILTAVLITQSLLSGCSLFKKNTDDQKTSANSKSEETTNIEPIDLVGTLSLDNGFTSNLITDKDSALSAVNEVADVIGISNTSDELLIESESSVEDYDFYRFKQMYNGIEVYGKEVIVVADDSNKAFSLSSTYEPVYDLDLNAKLSNDEVKKMLSSSEEFVSIEDCNIDYIDQCIYFVNNDPVLCYKYCITGEQNDRICAYTVLADSDDGSILYQDENIDYDQTYYSLNDGATIVNDINFDGEDSNPRSVDISEYNNQYQMYDLEREIIVWRAANKLSLNWFNLLNFELDHYIWDKDTDCPSKVGITALKNIQDVYDYYKDSLKWISTDGGGQYSIWLITDDLSMHNNAAFLRNYKDTSTPVTVISIGTNDNSITYGNYLDIMAHEYTHALSNNILNEWSSKQGKAMNEAYADIMGEIIEHSITGTNDWKINSLRNIADPSSAMGEKGKHIVKYSDYKDSIDCHLSSTLISHTAYLMNVGYDDDTHSNTAINMDTLGKLWFYSLQFLPSDCSFADCRRAVSLSANILNAKGVYVPYYTINKAFDEAGIANLNPYYSVKSDFTLSVYESDKKTKVSDYHLIISKYENGNFDNTVFEGDVSEESRSLSLENGDYLFTIQGKAEHQYVTALNVKVGEWFCENAHIDFYSYWYSDDNSQNQDPMEEQSEAEKYAQIVFENESIWLVPLNDSELYGDAFSCWFEDVDFDGSLEFIVGGDPFEGSIATGNYNVYRIDDSGSLTKINDESFAPNSPTINTFGGVSYIKTEKPGLANVGYEVIKQKDSKEYIYICASLNSQMNSDFDVKEADFEKDSIKYEMLCGLFYFSGYTTNQNGKQINEIMESYKSKHGDEVTRDELKEVINEYISGYVSCKTTVEPIPCTYKMKSATSKSGMLEGAKYSCYDYLSDSEKIKALVSSYNAYSVVETADSPVPFTIMLERLEEIINTTNSNSNNTSLDENELKKLIDSSSSYKMYSWDFADYDGNGSKEGFALFVNEWDYFQEVRFIDSEGNITTVRDEPFGMFTSGITGVDYSGSRFATISSALGQAWRDRTLIYGVKNNVPYELNLSGQINGLYIQNGKPYTDEYQFGDNAQIDFWAVPLELKYDADSKEFLL